MSPITAPTIAPDLPLQLLLAEGPDARSFLQGQLTQDLSATDQQHHTLAGYCTAQGRLLAIARVWALGPDRYALLLPREIAETTRARLSRFVMRAKLQLSLSDTPVFGLWLPESGPAAQDLGLPSLPSLDTLAPGVWAGTEETLLVLACPSSQPGWRRCLGLGLGLGMASPVWKDWAKADPERWQREDLACGLPSLAASSLELFTPQMANLDLVGGVSFQKGCYPGQEVVARSHFLGAVKRRTQLYTLGSGHDQGLVMQPGQDLFLTTDTDTDNPETSAGPVATVLAHAHDLVLACVGFESMGKALSPSRDHAAPRLLPLSLPYPLPDPKDRPARPKL